MRLRESAPKCAGSGPHRELRVEETWARIEPHLRRVGVTRMADITGLDLVGIPVYSAMSPRSNDSISVYSGKGTTLLAAKVSAAMEAVERFAAWLPLRPALVASYEELTNTGRVAMNPRDHSHAVAPGYRDDAPISWVAGWDLLNEVSVLVPLAAAVYQRWSHEPVTYDITTTNGLASGSSLEEAVCHALCELIERDAVTIAEVVSGRLPQVLERGLGGLRLPVEATDRLRQRHPRVALGSLPPAGQRLVELFARVDLEVRLLDLTSDVGVPTFFAAVTDDLGPNTSGVHSGIGTHPDRDVALVRAITECAQSRAGDIHAVREDIALPDADVPYFNRSTKRSVALEHDNLLCREGHPEVMAADQPSAPSDDVMVDVRFMLDRLRSAGIRRVIAVDLSPPSIPAHVVRVLAPGLESWAVDHSKLGARVTAAWNAAARAVVESGTGGGLEASAWPARVS